MRMKIFFTVLLLVVFVSSATAANYRFENSSGVDFDNVLIKEAKVERIDTPAGHENLQAGEIENPELAQERMKGTVVFVENNCLDNSKFFKDDSLDFITSIRTRFIRPGDLRVAGCFSFKNLEVVL